MTNTLVLPTSNGERDQSPVERSTALLLATDGTAQSDGAIAFAYLLSQKDHNEVIALTVVERTPIPWGGVDRSVVLEYERGRLLEAQRKVAAQVERLGSKTWTIEVRSGDPTTTISAMAKESGARLLVVGLGGHGPAARFFGNETALRLMRACHTPVLAVDTRMRALPNRIVVAMDFGEASIESARLALDIAAPGATLTLVHVVPWERRGYVPQSWFREHEAYIAGQLKRVAGWLDHDTGMRIHQQVLYGKPGSKLLAFAEELHADLIVAGTHGRNFLGRMLAGQTVSKLVRGAARSVLVFPHGAAFKRLEQPLPENGVVENHTEWIRKLDDFSRRNTGRRGRLEIDDPALGAQLEMVGYRFLGASYDVPTKRAQVMFGNLDGVSPHLVRGISNVRSVDILRDEENDSDRALSIVSEDEQTLLLFEGTRGVP